MLGEKLVVLVKFTFDQQVKVRQITFVLKRRFLHECCRVRGDLVGGVDIYDFEIVRPGRYIRLWQAFVGHFETLAFPFFHFPGLVIFFFCLFGVRIIDPVKNFISVSEKNVDVIEATCRFLAQAGLFGDCRIDSS